MPKKKSKRKVKTNPSLLVSAMDREELLALRREINTRLEELRYDKHVREVKSGIAAPKGWGPGPGQQGPSPETQE